MYTPGTALGGGQVPKFYPLKRFREEQQAFNRAYNFRMRPAASLLFVALLACGCSVARVVKDANPVNEDPEIAQEFAAGQEAREWLAREDAGFFEISKETGRQIIEKLYAAGSPMVKITDSEKLEPSHKVEVAVTIVAEMPTDPDQRKKLLAVEQEIYEEDSPEPDNGQKYVVIVTD